MISITDFDNRNCASRGSWNGPETCNGDLTAAELGSVPTLLLRFSFSPRSIFEGGTGLRQKQKQPRKSDLRQGRGARVSRAD